MLVREERNIAMHLREYSVLLQVSVCQFLTSYVIVLDSYLSWLSLCGFTCWLNCCTCISHFRSWGVHSVHHSHLHPPLLVRHSTGWNVTFAWCAQCIGSWLQLSRQLCFLGRCLVWQHWGMGWIFKMASLHPHLLPFIISHLHLLVETLPGWEERAADSHLWRAGLHRRPGLRLDGWPALLGGCWSQEDRSG